MWKAHDQEKAPNGKHFTYILRMFKQRKGKGSTPGRIGNSNGLLHRLCGSTPSGPHHGVARHSVIWTCCAGWVSNCLDCQGSLVCFYAIGTSRGCQRFRSRTMAFMMVNSLCMQAVRATFLALPAARRRS